MLSTRETYADASDEAQQVQHVAEVTDREVSAILATIANRLAHEEPAEVADYIRVTLAEWPPVPTHMDDTTAIRIGRWLALAIAQAADDRDEMVAACVEGC